MKLPEAVCDAPVSHLSMASLLKPDLLNEDAPSSVIKCDKDGSLFFLFCFNLSGFCIEEYPQKST